MAYIIIELPMEEKDGYSFAEFNRKQFEEEKGISLYGEPVRAETTEGKLILVFEGETIKRKPAMGFTFPVSPEL